MLSLHSLYFPTCPTSPPVSFSSPSGKGTKSNIFFQFYTEVHHLLCFICLLDGPVRTWTAQNQVEIKPGHTCGFSSNDLFPQLTVFLPALSNVSTKNICSCNTELPEKSSAGPLPSQHIKASQWMMRLMWESHSFLLYFCICSLESPLRT